MIKDINDIKPSPFAINQVRMTVENLGGDLKFHLKKINVSEAYYKEATAFIKSHPKDYDKWMKDHEDWF